MQMIRALYIVTLIGLCLHSLPLWAQNADSTQTAKPSGNAKGDKPPHVKTKFGVFGNITTGVTLGFFGKLSDDLIKEDALKGNFTINNLGSLYGGNIFFQIGNRFLIGGGGMGLSYTASVGATKEREVGQIKLRSEFFTGTLGFVLLNRTRYVWDNETDDYEFKYRFYLFPYIGFGGGKTTMRVSNYFDKEIYFGGPTGALIETAKELDFTSKLNILELGLGTRFFKNKKGGLMLGAEIGGYFNVGGGKWKYTDPAGGTQKELTQNVSDVSVSGIYFRVTAGGGWLKINDPAKSNAGDAYVKPEETNETAKPVEENKKEEKKK